MLNKIKNFFTTKNKIAIIVFLIALICVLFVNNIEKKKKQVKENLENQNIYNEDVNKFSFLYKQNNFNILYENNQIDKIKCKYQIDELIILTKKIIKDIPLSNKFYTEDEIKMASNYWNDQLNNLTNLK